MASDACRPAVGGAARHVAGAARPAPGMVAGAGRGRRREPLGTRAPACGPRSQLLGPALHRLPQPGSRVALTFDDGPDPAATPQVLDLLAAAGVTASFFCVGRHAQRHPALLRRIAAEGHGVENHSQTHPYHFACLVGSGLRREVEDAQSALADIAGCAPTWFRAPMGLRNPLLDPALHRAGLHLASWSRRGYDTRCGTPDTVLSRLSRHVTPGEVLLLHDGNCASTTNGTPVVLAVLPRLLAHLREHGITPVKLPGATPAAAAAGRSPTPAGCASQVSSTLSRPYWKCVTPPSAAVR